MRAPEVLIDGMCRIGPNEAASLEAVAADGGVKRFYLIHDHTIGPRESRQPRHASWPALLPQRLYWTQYTVPLGIFVARGEGSRIVCRAILSRSVRRRRVPAIFFDQARQPPQNPEQRARRRQGQAAH